MSEIVYFRTKHFDRALKAAKLGGPSRRMAQKVSAVLGSIADEDPFAGLSVTNHGEARLPKCRKYDLGDGWRLVTVQDSRTCGFVFMGDHADVDHFLNQHQGARFGLKDGKLVPIPGQGSVEVIQNSAGSFASAESRLLELLGSDEDYVLEGLPARAIRRLDALERAASSDEITSAVSEIGDEKRRSLLLDVLGLLIAGNEEGWKARIAYERGDIRDSDDVDDHERIIVEDGDEIRSLRVGSPEYERYMAQLESTSPWHDWFLYLHPEQEKVVSKTYGGSAQLSGVSGSGKTCVLVRRAVRLAEEGSGRVLVLTLNRSLAGLLEQLIDACADSAVRERIEVSSFFELAKRLLLEFEHRPETLEETTWKLSEHVDEVFREFFRCWLNNEDAAVLRTLHRQLCARGICAENYLREEFDWIRSALLPSERSDYLKMERSGRRVPITEDRRKDVLAGLAAWERKMDQVGLVDYLALANALGGRAGEVLPRFRHVLVDEAQDFGTTELAIVRKLVPRGTDDIFLCGDIAQSVLPKQRSLVRAGVTLTARDRIVKNYRNSREILRAAYDLLVHNLDDDLFEDDGLELLDPSYANFSGPAPLALCAEDLEHEIALARGYARDRLLAGVKSVCIAIAGFTARDVTNFAQELGEQSLNGLYDPLESPLVFSDLEQTKGYEFDTLIVVNCSKGVLPAFGAPEEEVFRQGCKLYVAMTRARRELILSFSRQASPWIAAVSDTITVEEWSDVEELDPDLLAGVPEVLPDVPEADERQTIGSLTGAEYLYTDHAIGLSSEAQQKLQELVDGRGAVAPSGKRLRWRSLSTLAADLGRNSMQDKLFGSKTVDEVRASLAAAMPDTKIYPRWAAGAAAE